MEKISIHEKVTQQIIDDMSKGILTWEKPFHGGLNRLPVNPSTGNAYQGINTLVLWSTAHGKGYRSNQWLTFKQASDKGFKVRKGEKATSVVFYKTLTVERDTEDEKNIPMLRQYSVFNLEQIDGAESLIDAEVNTHYPKNSIESCKLADQAMSIATVNRADHYSPSYLPSLDIIRMPLTEQFKSQVDYYATALHELTHWTGHSDRLDRLKHSKFGDHNYAFEELVAELGASFLCAELGLEYTSQHAAYIQSWLKALRSDNKMIFKAAAQAQKAVSLIKEKSGLSIKQSNEGAA